MAQTSESTIRRAKGPTILLGSGNYYDFENPEGSEITIEDFAYGLAFQSRFAGQCIERATGKRAFYAIAQHCVLMSDVVDPKHAYEALMHEACEPVCHDLTAPLKSMVPGYKAIEKRCEAANLSRFQVSTSAPDLIKNADLRMWATERRDLLPWDGERWSAEDKLQPYDHIKIVPVGPYEAAEMFIHRFNELKPDGIRAAEVLHG
jgi:uncharacterized protein